MISFKLTAVLYRTILEDLSRPHPIAAERAGFVFGRATDLGSDRRLILLTTYRSIPDRHYVEDDSVGARIGAHAITEAMQAVYAGRGAGQGIFHVHLHCHNGPPRMSSVDHSELPPMLPGFHSVGRGAPHGIMILSLTHAAAWVYQPEGDLIGASRISVIGSRLFSLAVNRRAA